MPTLPLSKSPQRSVAMRFYTHRGGAYSSNLLPSRITRYFTSPNPAATGAPSTTGLILKPPKPDVSKSFLKHLKKDIKLYRELISAEMMHRGIFHASVLEKLKKSIDGQLQFLAFIRGKQDKEYLRWAALA